MFWRADDGVHELGKTWAVSEKQAVNNVWFRQTGGEIFVFRARMFAEPVPEQLELFSAQITQGA